MSDSSAFEKLSSGLSYDERLKLLERINTSTDTSDLLLISGDDENGPAESPEIMYACLPWYKRLWFSIVGFFTGKNSLDVFINSKIADIGRNIDLTYPGIFYWHKCSLRQNFQTELKKLKDAARFFYGIFDSSISRNMGGFFVFLGSFEMQELHATLSEKTTPVNFAANNPGFSDKKLRQMAVSYVESEINNISESNRNTMYKNAHTLVCLKHLASYLFDRFIISFNQTSTDTELVCPAAQVKGQLMNLNDILFSIKKTPSPTLLSTMFMFLISEREDDPDYDMEKELQKFTSRAEKAIDMLRTFNHRVPITNILRCVTRNTSYMPAELTGGEDWFVLFRNSWVENVTHQFTEYIKERLRFKIQELYTILFDDAAVEPFEKLNNTDDVPELPVNNIQSLYYLLTFHKTIFMPAINVFIRPILIDGDFIKKENKGEFTEAYNILIKLDDTIKGFLNRLMPSGDLGKRWKQIAVDIQSVTVRRRKTAAILEEINNTADTTVSDAQRALVSLKSILGGIIDPSKDNSYDSLTNFQKISGKGSSFKEGLEKAIEKLGQIISLLKKLDELREIG
ncbi:MAG: DUF5312 domain-containing protein [Spirochaetaceae bacterium]|nr:DUF5312 domain-containing protein [Spirochaetaceae bacterium]